MLTRLDDALIDHDKVEEAGLRLGKQGYLIALGAVAWAICYANKKLTDGLVPERALQKYGIAEATAQAMLAARLWERVEGGYRIHDFHDWNPSSSAVKDKRKRDRERKRVHAGFRDESRPIPRGKDDGNERDGVLDTSQDASEASFASPPHARAGAPPDRDRTGRERDRIAADPAHRLHLIAAGDLSRDQAEHAGHAFCWRERSMCVPTRLHDDLIRRIGGPHQAAHRALIALYERTRSEYGAEAPILDGDRFRFWTTRYTAWRQGGQADTGDRQVAGVANTRAHVQAILAAKAERQPA